MMAIVQRWIVIGLLVALASAGFKIFMQQREIADLQLRAEQANSAALVYLKTKLLAQKNALDRVLLAEAIRQRELEAKNHELLEQAKKLADYQDRLAESLRLVLNGMFREPAGTGQTGRTLPTHPRIAAECRSPTREAIALWRPE